MTVSFDELSGLQASASYARFVHTNLHLHTPATPWDWNGRPDQTQSAATITPDVYFEHLTHTSLGLVAITDHNCVVWCEPLIDLARKARKAGTSRLHVLPGVEITTYEGPHLLALFDEDCSIEELRNLIVRLGMSGNGLQDDHVSCHSATKNIPISEVLAEVAGLKGLVIAPHVQGKEGLWGPKEFKGRTDVLNDRRLRLLAAPSGHIKRVTEKPDKVRLLYKTMDSDVILNSFGFINISDCHRLEDFEKDTTWIKMGEPSLVGIRQLMLEPELRVSHEMRDSGEKVAYPVSMHFVPPVEPSHPHFVGIAISKGMLDGQKVAFSPHQNSIIGKNYAGKSALLDCIRFAADACPADDDSGFKFVRRLRAIVTEGGQVRLYLRTADSTVYGISRVLSCTKVGSATADKWKLDSSPVLYRLWNGEFHQESDMSLVEVMNVEIYPQGEVVKIKDNASRQMSIVNALGKLGDPLAELTDESIDGKPTIVGQLHENSRTIIDLLAQRNSLEEEVADMTDLEAEVESLEKLVASSSYKEIQQWADLVTRLDGYESTLSGLVKSWSAFEPSRDKVQTQINEGKEGEPATENAEQVDPSEAGFDPTQASTAEFGLVVDRRFQATMSTMHGLRADGVTLAQAAQVDMTGYRTQVEARLKAAKARITEELPADEQAEETGLIERIQRKRQKIAQQKKKLGELEDIKRQIDKLQETRATLLERFRKQWADVRTRRQAVVKMIDLQSADDISAELLEAVDTEGYLKLLDQIADGLTSATNKISNRQAQLSLIAEKVTPAKLIEIVRNGDANALTVVADGVSLNTARILLGMGEADIHRLELCELDDRFVIGYRKFGETGFTPVDGGLSGGEQALALISVAMVPKELPLLIDQPEDELGPALITGGLVDQIRRVKPVRQMIFVTHVPNIPILADSEQIVYVQQKVENDTKRSWLRHCGCLDNEDIVRDLLEIDGGDVAFQKRSERYASLTKAD
jgi:hypothetical protein